MNKKIKMIELLNMIANGELKDKTRFKVYSSCKDESDIPYICEYDKTEPGIIWCITSYDSKFNFKIDYMRILNYYVEILEDNTEEIEEIEIDENNYIHTKDGAWKGRKMDIAFAKIINKLIENVREMKEGKK